MRTFSCRPSGVSCISDTDTNFRLLVVQYPLYVELVTTLPSPPLADSSITDLHTSGRTILLGRLCTFDDGSVAQESLSTSWDLCLHHLSRYDNMSSIAQKSSQLLQESAKRLLQVGITLSSVSLMPSFTMPLLIDAIRIRTINPHSMRDTISLCEFLSLTSSQERAISLPRLLNIRQPMMTWTIYWEVVTLCKHQATSRLLTCGVIHLSEAVTQAILMVSMCGIMLLSGVRHGRSCLLFLSLRRFPRYNLISMSALDRQRPERSFQALIILFHVRQ